MHKFTKNLLALATVISIAPVAVHANLVINELMQSNIECIMDDLNEFPDSWVELYNPGPESENLADYSIGTKEKASKAYRLPELSIPSGGFTVIYCDKAEQGLHTDFRLESAKGGAIYLFKNGEITDRITDMKKQPAPDIAFGKETEDSDTFGYQATPTPGAPNCGQLCKEILPEPLFSHKGRISSQSFDLSLSIPEGVPDGTVIRYTLDGKEPTTNSSLYSSPIRISGTKTVRARLFCEGMLSPRSTTHSFISHPRALTLPVVSMVTDRKYFYDNKLGIYTQGAYSPGTPNYEYDWRRPVNIEYFETADSESCINQLCETRVKGGATRGNPLKSLAVYANKRFGTKRFYYEFFPDQTPGISEFKSFEMRNSGNDFDGIYMRDAIIQQSMGMNCDLDWQPSRPVIFYINGEYHGILNIRPRSNEDNVYSFHDGLEDIDIIENWHELKEGSMDNFNSFRDFYSEEDHSFEEFDTLMDVSEFCNLMIMDTFFDNKDFPGNNIVMWRPTAEGGRWRWIAKDTDFGMGLYGVRYNYPTLNWITTPGYDNNLNEWANKEEHSRLFRRLLATEEFKDMLIDRAAIYMGDFLRSDAIIARLDARENEIKTEYKYHRDRINPWWNTHAQELENAKNWTRQRPTFFYTHLASFFGLNQPVSLSVTGTEGRSLIINDITVKADSFNGKYFPERNLNVQSVAVESDLFVNGWKVKVTNGGTTSVSTHKVETLSIPMPKGSAVAITPIFGSEPLAVETLSSDTDSDSPCLIYDTAGRHIATLPASSYAVADLSSLTPGIYIIRQGTHTKKITLQ